MSGTGERGLRPSSARASRARFFAELMSWAGCTPARGYPRVGRSVRGAVSDRRGATGLARLAVDASLGQRPAARDAEPGEPAVLADGLPELGRRVAPFEAARGAPDAGGAGHGGVVGEIDNAVGQPDTRGARVRRPLEARRRRSPRPSPS